MSIIKIIREFLIFRKLIKETSYIKLDRPAKMKLSTYDKEFERELSDLVLSRILDLHIKDELPRDFILGAQMWNSIRLGMMRDYIKEEQELK